MQRRSSLRQARRDQIASEYRRYGIHPVVDAVRLCVAPALLCVTLDGRAIPVRMLEPIVPTDRT